MKDLGIILGIRPDVIRVSKIIKLLSENKNITYDFIWSGQHYSENMKDVFFKQLNLPKPDFEFEIGGAVQGNGPQGTFLATVESFNDEEVVLDLNHPLAGEELTFQIELVDAEVSESEQQIVMSDWNASMRKAELLEVAKSRGLPVNTRSTKAQIIEALQAQ